VGKSDEGVFLGRNTYSDGTVGWTIRPFEVIGEQSTEV
jgi:hypothetical protein